MRVLLVEDDEPTRRVEIRILENAGHVVSWAATGDRALEQLRYSAIDFDVVILDLGLPGKSGEEIAGIMRCDPILSTIPIVVVTGKSSEELAAGTVNPLQGVTVVLGKPVDGDHLLAVLRHLETTEGSAAVTTPEDAHAPETEEEATPESES